MIDNFVVFAYLALVLGIGIYYRAPSNNFKNYVNVSNNNTSRIVLVATIFAAAVGGGATFGITEKVFSSNLAYTYGLILAVPVDFLIGKYIIPLLIKHRDSETVGDIMAKYYGLSGRFIAGTATIIVSVGLLAAQINVSGRIFQYILRVDYVKAVILSYGIVIIYTTVGGFRSVVFTNVLQFFAIIVAIPAISIIGVHKIGMEDFIAHLPWDKITISDQNHLLRDTVAAGLSFAVMGLYPSFIQRTLISSNHRQTSKAIYIKSIIYIVFLVFVTINGLVAYNLYPSHPASMVLPYLISQVAPVGLQGFIVIGLLAAVMSTADSDLNVTSISIVKDFLIPIFHLRNQKHLLLIARVTNIIIGSGAIIIALKFASVVELVIFITGFWGPMILVPLIFALFDKIVSQRAMIFTSFVGVGSFLLWEYFSTEVWHFGLKGVFVGTMISFLAFVLFMKIQAQQSTNHSL